MNFARQAGIAAILITLTLWFQCAGMSVLIYLARKYISQEITRLNAWRAAILMIRFTVVIVVLHLFQIVLWAGFYRWKCLPTWESCLYFSAASYSTVGYGDVVLPRVWRTLGPVESVIGVLMCGISVSALFAIAAKLVESEVNFDEAKSSAANP
jgi:hypothetical protein